MSRWHAFDMCVPLDDGTVTVSGKYLPGSPARTWGPPEHCDPGYPSEAEIDSVVLDDDPESLNVVDALTPDEYQRLVDHVCEQIDQDDGGDDYDDSRDYDYPT